MFKKFLNKIGKKIVSCPSCMKRMRIPVRPSKTLLVSCPGCSTQFQMQFKTIFSNLPRWQTHRKLSYNLKSYLLYWKSVSIFSKILIISIICFCITLISTFAKKEVKTDKRPYIQEL
ncbi:MAG: hypothetical protein HOJ35_13265 [Bdellovibrionales bacterium]|jgi:hypothetical protein|nr:hypothetical protein [Bdellovibrionales bacterium]